LVRHAEGNGKSLLTAKGAKEQPQSAKKTSLLRLMVRTKKIRHPLPLKYLESMSYATPI
jgi:hypothetical protein